ncbi:MAG: GTP 3',8-cyclase MoaA, partial [Anaerostipes faecalis]|nr:GTP 3',8-cyclase MoaA [Anaerostipes faecalis]
EIVKDAIIAASEAGLSVKINTVLESETSMEDIWAFIDFVKNHRVPVRFIERMPMGFEYEDFSILDKEAILTKIIKKGIRIEKISDTSSIGNGPATYYKLDGYDGLIGFIEALHGKFCHMCNRIRLTSAGQLKPCLYYPETLNLRDMIRNKYDEDEMMQEIKKAIYEKPKSHDFEKEPSEVNMSSIGG